MIQFLLSKVSFCLSIQNELERVQNLTLNESVSDFYNVNFQSHFLPYDSFFCLLTLEDSMQHGHFVSAYTVRNFTLLRLWHFETGMTNIVCTGQITVGNWLVK